MATIKSITTFKHDYMRAKTGLDFKDVKAIRSSYSEYDEKGQLIKENTYFSDGKIEHQSEYKYNDNGKMVEEFLINEENEIDERKAYEYNEKGVLVKELLIYLDDSFDTIEYLYNDDGKIIEKNTFDSEMNPEESKKMTYENKLLSSENTYDAEGKMLKEIKLQYDEKGNLTQRTSLDTIEEKFLKTIYLYNEKNIVTDVLTYNSDDQLIGRSEQEANDNEQIVKIIEEDQHNYNHIEMIYDAQNNIVEQTETNKAGELNSKLYRKFDEENNLIEVAVTIDKHGYGLNQNYLLEYHYEYF